MKFEEFACIQRYLPSIQKVIALLLNSWVTDEPENPRK
jgi:hypothetical protein